MPLLKVNQIASYTGNTLTIGTSTDTVEFTGGVVKASTIQNSNSSNLIVQTNTTTVTIGSTGQTISLASGASSSGFGATYNSGLNWTSTLVTSALTVAAGTGYFVNTSTAAITLTLPASPTFGSIIGIADYSGYASTNNITINPNGNKLEGGTGNKLISTNKESVLLNYTDTTRGWIPTAGANTGTSALIPSPYSATVLTVGGGGGASGGTGGINYGSGAAGGILRSTTITITAGTVFTATVGSGGAGAVGAGGNGTTSSFTNATSATGGNGAGTGFAGANNADFNGAANGGGSVNAGGGAGAGGNGSNMNGGIGATSSIEGTSNYYGGGGGGGGSGTGGLGGGADGTSGNPLPGTANSGGGGGGGNAGGGGSSGGTGVVILSVPTASYSGTTTGSPTVTTSGSNTIIKFTGSGTYTG
jgi:hypothetical protein